MGSIVVDTPERGLEWKRFGIPELAVLGAAVTNLAVVGQLAWTLYVPGSDASGAALLRRIVNDFEQYSAYLTALIFGPTLLSACLLFLLWRRWRPGTGRGVGWSFVPLLLTLGLVTINVALIQGPGLVALTIPLVAVPAIMGVLEGRRYT
jgi:hypothetical protein